MSNTQGSHRAACGTRRDSETSRPDETRRIDGPGRRGGTDRASHRPELRRLLPRALVVAFLAGSTSAFLAGDKAVEPSAGGVPRTVHTFAGDAARPPADEGAAVGAHDTVAPAPGAGLVSGDGIAVRHGRPVLLTLGGHRRQVRTTVRALDGAPAPGVRAGSAALSVSRSSASPRRALAPEVRTGRAVTFAADARERTVRAHATHATHATTVDEALAEAGIAPYEDDTTSVPGDGLPGDGQSVGAQRITSREQVREEAVPYDTVRTEDPALFRGTEVVDQQGRPGLRRVTYGLRTVDGVQQEPRVLHEEVVRAPVTHRVRVGTKALPTSMAGVDDLNWKGLAACESSGRPDAVDPSGKYGGLYQFDLATWRSVGGRGRPQDATPEEQTYRAKKLYMQRGASPWPYCGRRLTG
ncbi:resuscitation-promoting factor [Streptomyces lushanensis]|uniref:resuscitation-promoting factor n=1 Tax=Streptomyces lushanensis TaxID=1434255 RepID=UPI00082CEE6C|nr:resuscitation-promoting factor [Streptomyces lushanensis]